MKAKELLPLLFVLLLCSSGCGNHSSKVGEGNTMGMRDSQALARDTANRLVDAIWNKRRLEIYSVDDNVLEIIYGQSTVKVEIGDLTWNIKTGLPTYIGVVGVEGNKIELNKNLLVTDDFLLIALSDGMDLITPLVICEANGSLTAKLIMLDSAFQPDFILVNKPRNQLVLDSRYDASLSTSKQVISVFEIRDCTANLVHKEVVSKWVSDDTTSVEKAYTSRYRWLYQLGLKQSVK